jgi:cytosine/adenosine deaminase-related metal-dependent hydrolase
MATAYTMFTNGGSIRPLTAITRIVVGDKTTATKPAPLKPISKPEPTYLVTNMMRSVVNEGTAAAIRIEPASSSKSPGKTRHDQRSARRVVRRFTPELLTGRVGRASTTTSRSSCQDRRALPVWMSFTKRALRRRPDTPFTAPDGLVTADIDKDTGGLATARVSADDGGNIPARAPAPKSTALSRGAIAGAFKLGDWLKKIIRATVPLLIRNATDPHDERCVGRGTGRPSGPNGERIAGIGKAPGDLRPDRTIDAEGALVLPGFIQTHIHLCQTLFRGSADDLPLLAWLRTRVWPLEAAHDELTLAAAARLAVAELQASGTTSVLTMETVHGTDAVCEALVPTGMRAVVGKCLMDERGDAPERLHQPMREALDESLALHKRWHGAANGRLRTALAPRFALSCTPALLEATAALSAAHQMLVHTHASEQREEIDAVRRMTGMDNVAYLASLGLATERLCAAHCVWVTDAEQALMAERSVRVLHCPGSNLKLGSGIAPVPELRARGVSVSLGADGAACNNTLDMFHEMRLAATLQAMRLGPGALTARDAVWMATREGALALGQSESNRIARTGQTRRPDRRPLRFAAHAAGCRSVFHAGLFVAAVRRARDGHQRRRRLRRRCTFLGRGHSDPWGRRIRASDPADPRDAIIS